MVGKVALAATWRPRGELKRMERMLPLIATEYQWLAIILPPDAHEEASQLSEIIGSVYKPEDFRVSAVAEWPRALPGAGRCAGLARGGVRAVCRYRPPAALD